MVIVESPSKSHTIGNFLGSNYKVLSSKGHIRDLAVKGKLGLGVDVENGFTPTYEVIPGKAQVIKELKKASKDADIIFLASDPDREGEAISYHLKEELGIPDEKYKRVLFNEITKAKVLESMNNPTKIDYNLVHSQETRRILDRIIGFRLSKLLQAKIGAKSAGRVQSVALKLIVDREREIEAFIPVEFWTITANFSDEIKAELFKYKNENIEIHTEDEANKILEALGTKYIIEDIDKKIKNKKSKPVFTTSSLQQEASTKLGFSAKRTMSVAQRLYEGINVGEGSVGLITYMRTDSIRMSDEFVSVANEYIEKEYGKEYLGYVKVSKKKDNVQDAHEGIRPTDVKRTPESIKKFLDNDEYKLYNLIYKRAIACLMSDAKVNATTIILDNNNYKFKLTGQILIFDGYLKVYGEFETSEDKILPDYVKDQVLETDDITKEQHFTKPPSRYTEAKLIKELEELGIGRPSTYAKIIDTIKEREYVTIEDKKFIPTQIGFDTTDKLQEAFSDFINVEYTSNMEKELDEIAEGELVWNNVLDKFWKEFEPRVKEAFESMEKKQPEKTGEVCPECGSDLVVRKGKYGEFVACSNFPTCKYIKKEQKEETEETIICQCPECKKGNIVERKTKKGKTFYGCSNYPKCKNATWDIPTKEACPNCKKGILATNKDGNVVCNKCDYIK